MPARSVGRVTGAVGAGSSLSVCPEGLGGHGWENHPKRLVRLQNTQSGKNILQLHGRQCSHRVSIRGLAQPGLPVLRSPSSPVGTRLLSPFHKGHGQPSSPNTRLSQSACLGTHACGHEPFRLSGLSQARGNFSASQPRGALLHQPLHAS